MKGSAAILFTLLILLQPTVYGFEETEVLNIKTPAKVLVQFQASKNVNDTVSSLADSRYEIVKTPVQWVFTTNDTDHFQVTLHIDYGNSTVKQTLVYGVYSGGDLVMQRYTPIESRNVSLSLDITTGESVRYPTTNEIVGEVVRQVRGELYALSTSLDHGLRIIDANDKAFGTVVIAQTIIAAFLALGLVGLFLRNEEVRGYLHRRLERFEPVREKEKPELKKGSDNREERFLKALQLVKDGMSIERACREARISSSTFYRMRKSMSERRGTPSSGLKESERSPGESAQGFWRTWWFWLALIVDVEAVVILRVVEESFGFSILEALMRGLGLG